MTDVAYSLSLLFKIKKGNIHVYIFGEEYLYFSAAKVMDE